MKLERTDLGNYICPDDPGELGHSGSWQRRSVTDEEARVLSALAVGLDVLEIGTGLGVSTRALASTARSVHTVDCDSWVWSNVWPSLPANVAAYKNRSAIDKRKFPLIFIDGNHELGAVSEDIGWAKRYLYRQGLLVLHDAKIPSVASAVKLRCPKASRIETACGMFLWRSR